MDPTAPCLPPLGEVPPQGAERVSPAKKKSPGGGLGIDFFPYHVILKIKRGAAGRREPLSSYRVTAERPSLWRLLLFYLENQRNDADDQNTELKQVGIGHHAITPLRCSGGGTEVSASSRKRGLPPTEYWQRQRISMRRGYCSTFCRIWQDKRAAPKGGFRPPVCHCEEGQSPDVAIRPPPSQSAALTAPPQGEPSWG